MKIPFVGSGGGQARSPDASSERSVNCYVEIDQGNARAPAGLYGMPGMVLAHTLGGGPIRGSIQCGNFTYFVSGSQVFRRNRFGDAVQLENSLASFSGRIVMAQNGHEVQIADGSGGPYYVVNPPSETAPSGFVFRPAADPDLPLVIDGIANLNGYWIAWGNHSSTDADDQQYFWRPDASPVGDWNGLDFAAVESDPDAIIAGVPDHGQMWFVGSESTEILTNVADPDLPFQRSGSGFIDQGTIAPQSVRPFDNAVVWLAHSKEGQGIFIRTQGGSPQRFSDHKVEAALQRYQEAGWPLWDATAFTFQMGGHSFYACAFPAADATWVYDAASGLWSEWLWRDPADGSLHAHRAINHVFTADAKHLVGDRVNGNVYELRMDAYTDAGDPIAFIRRSPTVVDEMGLLTVQDLRIDMETGVQNAEAPAPQLMMRYYADGRTPSTWRSRRIGGKPAQPVRFGGLGQGRAWSFELQILDPVRRAVFGGYARIAKARGGG